MTDPDAPRRLDRIGIVLLLLLLDTDALTTGSQLPAHPVALDEDAPSGERAAMTYRLFDGSAPDRLQWDGEWVLGPFEHLMLRGRAGKRARERLRREGARRVPGLARGRRLLTVISVVPRDARRRERLRPCCPPRGRAQGRGCGRAHHRGLRAGGRRSQRGGRTAGRCRTALQRDGDGVLLVSHQRSALMAADVGVGVADPQGTSPWGADLYLDGDLAPAVVIVEACRTARETARRGVRLARAA